ncbi:DNA cytosine methyltransferase [Burkholderia cepacia]|uniref:DNA cytosine methyltransferase n=1 Tax=Burkholderia cepacia TaxID=292 RepID=UPI00075DBF5F|nr:DNA cytosine methyltransferase [Burkholderia cepacia]KVE77043.1 modification methylase [Burkholderia cepacia]MCA8030369.1 DNA cytosine methyltransferase [Burkholderia cepacia]RRA15455.1 DNA cytosine methyltransferase [Burkholderia cepacia]
MTLVVDLFAGPGGLGEGFASHDDDFDIVVSAEKDPVARETLRLRAFYRYLRRNQPEQLHDYFAYCRGQSNSPVSEDSKHAWDYANAEAQIIELGSSAGNSQLYKILDGKRLGPAQPWVLIGGPPCQAYSLVGRARNKGIQEYRPENDHRHFLYREYLNIIGRYQPAVFVMENVKGILSAKVGNEQIFHSILRDLSAPGEALGLGEHDLRYRICSLVCDTEFHSGDDLAAINPADYIIRAEQFGIPQARHRVILLGIREDFHRDVPHPTLTPVAEEVSVGQVIGTLPPLRSRLSKEADSPKNWQAAVHWYAANLARRARSALQPILNGIANSDLRSEHTGGLRYVDDAVGYDGRTGVRALDEWLRDERLAGLWLNHEARGHMRSDLGRYLYAAAFAEVLGTSPKGHADFDLDMLRPEHKNWETGSFADRFRVQMAGRPSTTITSHISKDGHYFIHYDALQCRSLTVREAARLQTFPDNYFFEGNRTQQYHQVGNAVPPLLASKVASLVAQFIRMA